MGRPTKARGPSGSLSDGSAAVVLGTVKRLRQDEDQGEDDDERQARRHADEGEREGPEVEQQTYHVKKRQGPQHGGFVPAVHDR